MKDTSMSVPAAKLNRFVSCYNVNPQTKKLELADPVNGQWSHPPVFPSGGSGLVSTVDDYAAFATMLRNKGRAGCKRILGESSVKAMTTNHLSPEQQEMGKLILGEGTGWGFGVSVLTNPDDVSRPPGRYGWNGGLGTSWWNDPNDDLTAIILTQRAFESANGPKVIRDFWKAAAQVTKN
jgi:CubicO group peptidase (beta-lactamase class C family)